MIFTDPLGRHNGHTLLRKFLVTLRNASLYVAFRIQLTRLLPERFGGVHFGR